ncbi:MAG: hypothetical protein M1817_004826 [Caeruleum heppii]|nr:MAG: hypothetical protein M1817_004826 [Caeruleum heppii]
MSVSSLSYLVRCDALRGARLLRHPANLTHKTANSTASGRRWQSQQSNNTGGPQDYQPQPGQFGGAIPSASGPATGKTKEGWGPTFFRMFESAATTMASLSILGLAGYGYHKYYKYLTLQKIENAFSPGDPMLDIAEPSPVLEDDDEIMRPEQQKINEMVDGTKRGHYYLIIGEKGTGKSSMLLKAMHNVSGDGISMFEAHANPEIFRIRIGKALDYEFHEDYIGSLFSIRGPRDTTALLDIERALNKLEKVALKRRETLGKPLVLIINGTHLLRDDEAGRDLLELTQQRAEQWAATNLVTVIFNSDDYWVYERLKQHGTRMKVLPVLDLPKDRAIRALRHYRAKYFDEAASPAILEQVYDRVGGRLSFLSRVASSHDMLRTCADLHRSEKTWFLNQCWILGETMDDDVMDQQKYCAAAMVLARALVRAQTAMQQSYNTRDGHILPQIPLHEARQIMTRADFIRSYDHLNIFTIDCAANVRADSVPMMNAMREVVEAEGFEELLEGTLKRIAEIESLGRTREVTVKDLWGGGAFEVKKGPDGKTLRVVACPGEEG